MACLKNLQVLSPSRALQNGMLSHTDWTSLSVINRQQANSTIFFGRQLWPSTFELLTWTLTFKLQNIFTLCWVHCSLPKEHQTISSYNYHTREPLQNDYPWENIQTYKKQTSPGIQNLFSEDIVFVNILLLFSFIWRRCLVIDIKLPRGMICLRVILSFKN